MIDLFQPSIIQQDPVYTNERRDCKQNLHVTYEGIYGSSLYSGSLVNFLTFFRYHFFSNHLPLSLPWILEPTTWFSYHSIYSSTPFES